VFAITLSVEEPDTRISIVSAEAPATVLAIAPSEEPASATAITPVAEAAPALGIVLVNVTIAVLSLNFLKEGAIICEADVTAELSIVVDCPADNWQTSPVDSDRGHFVHQDSICASSVDFSSYIYLGTGYFVGVHGAKLFHSDSDNLLFSTNMTVSQHFLPFQELFSDPGAVRDCFCLPCFETFWLGILWISVCPSALMVPGILEQLTLTRCRDKGLLLSLLMN
jgi:hypothetical protein